jgi:NNP family nitrate/nitrite transporter-like MFS transporter
VLGWTAAVAAYGPFLVSTLIGAAIGASAAAGGPKSAGGFFVGAAVFYAIATSINWLFYVRRGCERPS